MITSLYQSQGLRSDQEDRLLSLPDLGLYLVADGLGGHDRGAEAAQAAVDAVVQAAMAIRPSTPKTMAAVFVAAHSAVSALDRCWVTGTEHKLTCGCRFPATTLSVLCFDEEQAVIGHIGDTRIWCVTNGKAKQLTTDHHQFGGILAKVVGSTECAPDVFTIPAFPGDTFILVSDGVHLDGQQISGILATGPLETSAQRLVTAGEEEYAKHWEAKAKSQGFFWQGVRTDNASCLVVQVPVC